MDDQKTKDSQREAAEDKMINDAFKHLLDTYIASRHRKKIDIITKAFNFARQAHKGVRRLSGEPYIMHPIAVAQIACEEMGLGSTSICSALLHDVVEDTDYTVEEIGNINIQPHSRYVDRPANPPSETNERIREVHLTDAEVEAFRDLIRTAVLSTGRDDMVTQIISEELEPFFAGDRSAEDTAEIIQKRAAIYLAE